MKRLIGIFALAISILAAFHIDAWASDSQAKALRMPELPAIAPGDPVTLGKAFELAEQRNLTLAQSREEIEAARARLKSSWGSLLPDVYGQLNYVYYDHADSSTISGVKVETRTQQDLDASLSVSLPLISAQQWVGVAASKSGLNLSRMSAGQTRQELLFTVAFAYFQALSAQSLIDIYKGQLAAIERHLKVATFRHRSGIGTRLDVTRAQSDWITTQQSLIQAIYALENARDTLRTLIRIDTLPLTVEEVSLSEFEDNSEEAMIDKAQVRRYDLRMARLNLEVTQRQYLASYMQFVPTLSASWQFGYQITDPPANQANLDRSRWFAGLVLSVPLFDYNIYGSLQQSRAAKNVAQLAEQAAMDNAELEVRQLRRGYDEALDMVRSSQRQAEIAEESMRLAETYYENGRGTSLDVVDARRSSQSAQVNLVIKRLEAQLSKLNLLRATGLDMRSAVK